MIFAMMGWVRMNANSSGSIKARQAEVPVDRPELFYQRGFSLLELMIVIVIIGILSSIAYPAFSSWRERTAVNSAANSLLSHFKQARVMSVAENRSVRITFTSTGYTYDADTTSGSTCEQCRTEEVPLEQFSNEMTVSPTTTRTLTSRGTANAGTVTLTLGSTSREVTLNVIGRAYLQ